MTIEELRSFFGWMSVINIAFLLYWWLMFAFARPMIQRLHSKWFRLSDETFDTVHYAGMAVLKLGITLFNLVPYVALRIIS